MVNKRLYDFEHPNPFGVTPGQVWENLDPRYSGCRVKILLVREDLGHAIVERSDHKLRQIKLTRFTPWVNGYKLIQDV
jgi:hypothetical protein